MAGALGFFLTPFFGNLFAAEFSRADEFARKSSKSLSSYNGSLAFRFLQNAFFVNAFSVFPFSYAGGRYLLARVAPQKNGSLAEKLLERSLRSPKISDRQQLRS
jgi:hypothetical protein